MSKLIFKTITIEGFGSIIEPLTYKLKSPGINIISGLNGVGKTSIFSALTWVLYGYTLKKGNEVEPWDNVKPKDFQGTKVHIKFHCGKSYEVIRCEKYKGLINGIKGDSKILLYESGKLREDLRDKNDVKAEIERILGRSYDLFMASILFGQKMKRLIQEDGPKKKKVFDEAFEVGYLNEAKKSAITKLEKYQKELNVLEPQFQSLVEQEKTVKQLIGQLKNFQNTREAEIIAHTKELSNLQEEIDELQIHAKDKAEYESRLKINNYTVKEREKEIALYEKYSSKIWGCELQITNKEAEQEKIKGRIQSIGRSLVTHIKVCRECGQPINPEQQKAEKARLQLELSQQKNELAVLTREIESLKDTVKSGKTKVDKYKAAKAVIDEVTYESKSLEKAITNCQISLGKRPYLEERIKEIQNRIEKLKSHDNTLELETARAKRRKLINTHEPIGKQIAQIKDWIGIYEWVIKDPLSNAGIKAFIFNQMLRKVNKKLHEYSDILGYVIKFGIDLKSARKDFYISLFKGTKEISYNELSGGQQQLVDVCIAFSIHDVVTEQSYTNILVMDEIFENLDENNIEVVTDLLIRKSKDKSIHLITHLSKLNLPNANITKLQLNEKEQTELVL